METADGDNRAKIIELAKMRGNGGSGGDDRPQIRIAQRPPCRKWPTRPNRR